MRVCQAERYEAQGDGEQLSLRPFGLTLLGVQFDDQLIECLAVNLCATV